jgi:hypothetical protein
MLLSAKKKTTNSHIGYTHQNKKYLFTDYVFKFCQAEKMFYVPGVIDAEPVCIQFITNNSESSVPIVLVL